MKRLPWVIAALLAVACIASLLRWPDEMPPEVRTVTKIRTEVRVETLLLSPPMAPLLVVRLTDTMRIGSEVVQREQAYYEDSLYRVWVSGFRPRLDSLQIFPRTVTQTLTNDIYHTLKPRRKRWGLGIQAGYSYPGGWYVGAGVSWNILMW